MQKLVNLIILCLESVIFLSSCASSGITSNAQKRNLAAIKTQISVEYIKLKDYRNAVSTIEEAIKTDPNYSYAWMVKGIIYQSIKDYHLADAAYQKSLAIDPKSAEMNNNYGWFLCESLNHPSHSLDYFDRALADLTYPTPELAYMNKGICLAK